MYESVDSLTALISTVVIEVVVENDSKVLILKTIFTALIDNLFYETEKKIREFDQKPYFRLFSNLLEDVCTLEDTNEKLYVQVTFLVPNK